MFIALSSSCAPECAPGCYAARIAIGWLVNALSAYEVRAPSGQCECASMCLLLCLCVHSAVRHMAPPSIQRVVTVSDMGNECLQLGRAVGHWV